MNTAQIIWVEEVREQTNQPVEKILESDRRFKKELGQRISRKTLTTVGDQTHNKTNFTLKEDSDAHFEI